MRKQILFAIEMYVLLGAILCALTIRPIEAATIHVPADYSTIQAAVDASLPGDTIMVSSGTYHEALTINKPLNIIGSGASTTIINGSGVTLASAGLVKITENFGNLKFQGFTVSNAEPVGDDVRICIIADSNTAGPKYTISDCKIYGSNNPDEYNDYGFYASHGKESILFTHNLVTRTGCNNIVLERQTGATEISYNTLDAGVWGTDAIFFMTYNGVDVTTLQNVSSNTFDMGTGGPFDYDHRATGVSFCSVYPYYGTSSPAKFTNMVVSDNTFNNLQSNRRGIGFWIGGTGNDLVSPTITGNTITGVGQPSDSSGIDFVGSGTVSGANIIGNTITGTAAGIILRSGDASGAKINYNNIEGNTVGLDWTGGSQADARFNWWGDGTGPYNPELNPEGKGQNISDNVRFEPWLITPYPPANEVQALLYTDPSLVEYWTVASGNNFTANVRIANVTKLHAYEFKLYWNATLLNLINVQITPPWSSSIIGKNDTTLPGRYWLAVSSIGTSTFNGSTTLVRLKFKVNFDPIYPDNSTCTLELADTKLIAPVGVPIYHMVHDGRYSIYSTKPVISTVPQIFTAHAIGQIFTVNIVISNAVNLYNFSVRLSYNTTLLDAISLSVGPFLNPPLHISKQMIDDANGLVWLSVWSQSPASPANGTGILATVTFKVTKATLWKQNNPHVLTCSLDLHDTFISTQTHREIAHDLQDGTYRYEPKPGDLDSDGHVGLTDLRIVCYYYDPAYNSIADLNEDGRVDIADLSTVAYYYGADP